jgi:hypothetical protein
MKKLRTSLVTFHQKQVWTVRTKVRLWNPHDFSFLIIYVYLRMVDSLFKSLRLRKLKSKVWFLLYSLTKSCFSDALFLRTLQKRLLLLDAYIENWDGPGSISTKNLLLKIISPCPLSWYLLLYRAFCVEY